MMFVKKNKNRFCCDSFKYRQEGDRRMGINIRIVKIEEPYALDESALKNPFRFFLTEGYEKGDKNVKSILIHYCPFCGQQLAKYYAVDEFVNETDLSFLT